MTRFNKNSLTNVFTTAFAATCLVAASFLATPTFGQTKNVRYDDRGPTFSQAKSNSEASKQQPQISHRVPTLTNARRSKGKLLKRAPQSTHGEATFSTANGNARAAETQPQSQINRPTISLANGKGRIAQVHAPLNVPTISKAKGPRPSNTQRTDSRNDGLSKGNPPTYSANRYARASQSQPQAQLGSRPTFGLAKGNARAAEAQPQAQLSQPTFRMNNGKARAAQFRPQAQLGSRPTFGLAKGNTRAAESQPQAQLSQPTFRMNNGKARAAQLRPQAQLGSRPTFGLAKGNTRAAQSKRPSYREDNASQPQIQAQQTAQQPIWSYGAELIKGFCGTDESKTNGKVNRYDQTVAQQMSLTAQKLQVSGTAKLDMPGNCLNGEAVEYTFVSDNPEFEFQTGSSMTTSEPVIDESNPRMVVWTFDTAQGPNPYFDNEELHVIHSKSGLIFCTWTAQCRIEVDLAADGEVTQIWNGKFEIVGGTGDYRFASGNWDFSMMTEPNADELSENALFEFAGTIDMVTRVDNTTDGKAYRQD